MKIDPTNTIDISVGILAELNIDESTAFSAEKKMMVVLVAKALRPNFH